MKELRRHERSMNISNNKRKGGGEVKQTNRRVKRRKYALVGEDWGLEREQEEITSIPTKIKIPGEVQRGSWERRPLAIAWDGLKVLAIEWYEGGGEGVGGGSLHNPTCGQSELCEPLKTEI